MNKTENYPFVAVLLATYNGADFVESQIESILAQQKVRIRIYLSDDGSSDETLDIIKGNFINKYDLTIITKNPTKGSANNFYHLISNAKLNKEIEYIALSDQDDIWMSMKLISGINRLIETGSSGYSSGFYNFKNNIKTAKKVDKASRQTKLDFFFSSPGPGCTFILRRQEFEILRKSLNQNLPYFQSCTNHDWAIYAFYRGNNFKWVIDKNSFIYYRQHDTNVFGANKGAKATIRRTKLIFNLWYENEIISIINLVRYTTKYTLYSNDIEHFLKAKFKGPFAFQLRRKKSFSFLVLCLFTLNLLKSRKMLKATLET